MINVLEHTVSDQHKAYTCHSCASHARKANSEPIANYVQNVKSLLTLTMPEQERLRSIVMTMEGIAFEKYPAICVPQACQGVDNGHAYKTATSTKVFTHGSTSACGKIGLIINMSQRMRKHV